MKLKSLRCDRSATTSALAALIVWLVAVLAQPLVLAQTNPSTTGFRTDRILVKPKPGADLTMVHVSFGTKVLRRFPGIGNLQVLQLLPGADVRVLLGAYQQSGLVEYAEPDFIVQATLEPNDFRYSDGSLWGLHNTGLYGGTPGADIDAPNGWEIQNTAGDIVVAVIDTGVRYTHEDLAANIWVNPGESGPGLLGVDKSANGIDDDGDGYIDDVHGINAILGTGIPWDDHGHGTHVSGTIGGVGNNSVGVVGVAWRIQLMACKFLDATGHGSISDAITCIDYARKKGAKIINASWGDYTTDPYNGILADHNNTAHWNALHDAIASARDAGILFVAACGNDDTDNDVHPLYPASYADLDNLIAVAATDRSDSKASFSNYGANTVHLGAPGQDIFSCWNGSDSDYRYLSGTSMATPHVVGVCALVWSHYSEDSYAQIKSRVLNGVEPLPSLAGKCVTGGRLNLSQALGASATSPSAPAVVIVIATDPSASEAGPDPGTFTISRSGSTAQALTVYYTLAGTAQNGVDYQTLSGSVTIPTDASSTTVSVTPIDDNQLEGDETVVVTLSFSTGYTVGSPGSATVVIHDNDLPLPVPAIVSPTSGT
ncbi:MAG: hypothetical protein DME22_09400 [Verrucomicrobia bacterium]|nr:MAG: hypothetical protein DME22_09400 [Verrucomicrobiota bacterium]